MKKKIRDLTLEDYKWYNIIKEEEEWLEKN